MICGRLESHTIEITSWKNSYLNLRTKIVTQKHPSDIAAHRLEDEEHDLPDGWKAIPSRSRPGKISYLNLRTKL